MNLEITQDLFNRVTPREIEIAKAASEGMSIKETAENFGISKATVEAHRHNIICKLGTKSISKAVAILRNGGIIV